MKPLVPGIDSAMLDQLANGLVARDLRLITAESCTGGLVAATLSEQPGASAWLEGGIVTYRLAAKTRLLGVPDSTLRQHGAVSEPTARAMAEGALAASDASISVAITGLAGPDGGEPLIPVGTVWFAWALRYGQPRCVQTAHHVLDGDRGTIRAKAVAIAIDGLLRLIEDPPSER